MEESPEPMMSGKEQKICDVCSDDDGVSCDETDGSEGKVKGSRSGYTKTGMDSDNE